MLLQRSLMARCVVALTTLALATSAAPKDDKKKKDDKPGTSMDEGGKDPSASETFEAGQFVPGKKKTIDTKICAEGDEECEEESAAKAEEGNEAKAEPKKQYKGKKTVGVFAEALIGFGKAPEPGPSGSTTGDSTSFGFLLGGHFDVSSPFRLMLRVPVTTGTVKTFGNLDARETALGAPEVAARLRLGDPAETEWAIKLAVGVPVAQGNPDVSDTGDARGFTQARLQRVASAANGWHDPELYAMKRLPVSPSLQFLYRPSKFRLNAELKAVLLPKIGGGLSNAADSYKGGNLDVNGFGMWAILGGTASYEILSRKLFGALAMWATYEIAHDYTWEPGNPPSPFQFVIEPRVLAQFGKVVPSVGFVVPLGGQLGGNIYGLRVHVDVVF